MKTVLAVALVCVALVLYEVAANICGVAALGSQTCGEPTWFWRVAVQR